MSKNCDGYINITSSQTYRTYLGITMHGRKNTIKVVLPEISMWNSELDSAGFG
jgi:hypothetical protein